VAVRADSFHLLGLEITPLIPRPQGLALVEMLAPPGPARIPLHLHEHTEEGFYVLRGRIAIMLDDEQLVRDEGSYTVITPGQRHSFWNPGIEPAVYLSPVSPPGVDEYLHELAVGLARAHSEEEVARLRDDLMQRYDVVVVGPPPR
jgi:mannose-6-phosphate isomerase-like protein (cupin superfamily)